jgi:hypothetical protein
MAKNPPFPSGPESEPTRVKKRTPRVHAKDSIASCGASTRSPNALVLTDLPERVTCKRCLEIQRIRNVQTQRAREANARVIAFAADLEQQFPTPRRAEPRKYTQTRAVGQPLEVEKPRDPTCTVKLGRNKTERVSQSFASELIRAMREAR